MEVDLVNVYDWPKDTDLVLERGTFPATTTVLAASVPVTVP